MDKGKERLKELEDKVDDLSKYEQDFLLWCLLQNYINDCENELEKNTKLTGLGGEEIIREPKTRSEYATMIMLNNHARVAKEIRDVLAYSLW